MLPYVLYFFETVHVCNIFFLHFRPWRLSDKTIEYYWMLRQAMRSANIAGRNGFSYSLSIRCVGLLLQYNRFIPEMCKLGCRRT